MSITPASSTDSSPSSSPVLSPVDSSPLSSPYLDPCPLDPPSPTADLPLSHPFAGSTKATKRHPHYEKKTPTTPPAMLSRPAGLCRDASGSRSLMDDDFMASDTSSPTRDSPPHRTSRYLDREERLWEDALRRPFDTGIGHVDLSNQQLKSIPTSIADLSSFFNTPEVSEQTMFSGRSLSRVKTEPSFASKTRSFSRTQSIVDSGKERHVLQLYLSGNMISALPPQLFTLQNLSVLSLRGNQLTYLPGEICRLRNLRELNISLNRLTFLPWEIRHMTLEKLQLYPNPFLPEPSRPFKPTPSGRTLPSRRSITRLASMRKDAANTPSPADITVSPVTIALPAVPPLTELCLRILLSPVGEGHDAATVIAEYYDVPLSDQWNIPPAIHRVLAESVPGLLRPRKRFSRDASPHAFSDGRQRSASQLGTARCANPDHSTSVFVRHAAERFTWERHIAGVDVGAAVPLRWRGCMQTCLDFLDESRAANGKGAVSPDTRMLEANHQDSDDMDIDLDLDDVVQVVHLGSVGLSMDEFDD